MKAFGGGSLTGHYQEALDYVFSKDEIDSVMIGFGKIPEVDDLLSYLNGSMNKTYNPDISKKKCLAVCCFGYFCVQTVRFSPSMVTITSPTCGSR